MIISHKHKFIFIKPQKTAGTSVELMLSRICGDEDVITPLVYDPDPKVREKNNAKPPKNYKRFKPLRKWEIGEVYRWFRDGIVPNVNYSEHLRAEVIKLYVGDAVWNNYLKISVVRNPWDQAVSLHSWMSYYRFGRVTDNFKEYITNEYYGTWPFYSIKGIYDIDFMIQFESLADDIDRLNDFIPIGDNPKMPITKNKIREAEDYRSVYTPETKEMVRVRNLHVIDKFEYRF